MKDFNIRIGLHCIALSMLLPAKSFAYVIPKDLPTIEALIALHKAVKKDEDQALKRVATSFGEQSLVAKGAIKFNDVRTTLDTKLGNAHSYPIRFPRGEFLFSPGRRAARLCGRKPRPLRHRRGKRRFFFKMDFYRHKFGGRRKIRTARFGHALRRSKPFSERTSSAYHKHSSRETSPLFHCSRNKKGKLCHGYSQRNFHGRRSDGGNLHFYRPACPRDKISFEQKQNCI